MPEPRPMTPEELKDFEDRELHHEEPATNLPASESDGERDGNRQSPPTPIPNPD